VVNPACGGTLPTELLGIIFSTLILSNRPGG
jgi:hypothetical protein